MRRPLALVLAAAVLLSVLGQAAAALFSAAEVTDRSDDVYRTTSPLAPTLEALAEAPHVGMIDVERVEVDTNWTIFETAGNPLLCAGSLETSFIAWLGYINEEGTAIDIDQAITVRWNGTGWDAWFAGNVNGLIPAENISVTADRVRVDYNNVNNFSLEDDVDLAGLVVQNETATAYLVDYFGLLDDLYQPYTVPPPPPLPWYVSMGAYFHWVVLAAAAAALGLVAYFLFRTPSEESCRKRNYDSIRCRSAYPED